MTFPYTPLIPVREEHVMAGKTLFDKIWDTHLVREEPDGTTLLYIDRQLVHEVTSPQAFEGLKLAGRRPRRQEGRCSGG